MGNNNVKEINENINFPDASFIISIVGHNKAGKSSLLNLLIGEDILPSSVQRQTAFPVKIKHWDKEDHNELQIMNNGKIIDKIVGSNSINQHLRYVNKNIRDNKLIDKNEYNLYVKFNLLKNNNIDIVEFYDTPGYGEKNLYNKCNINIINSKVIYYVMSISKLGEDDIFEEYKKLINNKRDIYIIVNKIDELKSDIPNVTIDQIKNLVKEDFHKKNIILDKNKIIPISIQDNNNINELIQITKNILDDSKHCLFKIFIYYILNLITELETSDNNFSNKNIYLPEKFKESINKDIKKEQIIYGALFLIGIITVGILTAGIGSLVGMSAAAIASSLAAIGGGTIAAGGGGMIGGVVVLTIIGAISTGFVGFSGFQLYNSSYVEPKIKKMIDIDLADYIYESTLNANYKENGKMIEKKLYEGEFRALRYHGKGVLYYTSGGKFIEGNFIDGKLNGDVKIYDNNCNLIFNGIIERNNKVTNISGKYFCYSDNELIFTKSFDNEKINFKK